VAFLEDGMFSTSMSTKPADPPNTYSRMCVQVQVGAHATHLCVCVCVCVCVRVCPYMMGNFYTALTAFLLA